MSRFVFAWRDRVGRLSHALQRQVREIRAGGGPVLMRKTVALVETILAVPLVLLARALRPWVILRFSVLPSGSIGPFAAGMEIYLCERDAGLHGRRTLDIFSCHLAVSNEQLKTMWERVVYVNRLARPAERINRWLPGGQCHRMPWRRLQARDVHNLLVSTRPHLAFTPEEARQGFAALRELGVPEGVPVVCFHARDMGYYAVNRSDKRVPEREHAFRNSDIRTHLMAVEELTRRGYAALRVGACVERPLETSNPRIIDYSTIARSDLLDVFLCASCRFFIGDASGLASVPLTFRRPVALVNYSQLAGAWTWDPSHLFIPKKLWSRAERRLLTFPEILQSGIGAFSRNELFEQAGVEFIDNTPEEITALAVEMDERLRGAWEASEEDEELQRRFWALFRHGMEQHRVEKAQHGIIRSRMGAEFLRQNRALLDETTVSDPLVVRL